MVHGSPLAVNDFMWESLSEDDLRERAAASGADVLLIRTMANLVTTNPRRLGVVTAIT